MRQAKRHQQRRPHKRRWPRVLGILFGLIVILGILLVVFFTPLNNAYRSATGNDTPADSAVKNELVKQIDANKTGNPTVDGVLDQAATTLKNTKMSTIVAAAGNQSKFARLLQSTTGIPAAQANTAAGTVFATSALTPLREAIAAGDYVKAYQAYRNLDGTAKAQAAALLK